MKPFWLGLLGSFVGVMLLAAMAFYTDIFTIDRDGMPMFRVSDAGKITVGATESYVNLVIQNNAAVAGNKVDITADVLTVDGIRLENVNLSADITAVGAGGLQSGLSEAINTWYYVWVISNNDGTSSNGFLSTNSTSPTLPPGYTKKRRVGAVRNDGSGNFFLFTQQGFVQNYLQASAAERILSNGTATTFTTVSAAGLIPPTAIRGKFQVNVSFVHNAANIGFNVDVRKTGTSSTSGQLRLGAVSDVANQTTRDGMAGDCEIDTSQQIDYVIENAPATSGGVNIFVLGYYDRI